MYEILNIYVGIDVYICQAPSKKTKSSLNAKGFPDKDGKFDLYIFKNDLSKDFKNDPKLCMWRRDGSSLLQKYLKAQDDENDKDILFKASSVVSCVVEFVIILNWFFIGCLSLLSNSIPVGKRSVNTISLRLKFNAWAIRRMAL